MPLYFALNQWHLLAVDLKAIQTLSSAGRRQECLKACQQLLEKEAENPSAWNFTAKTLLALGQPENAL